jgi:hypothetical protein
MSDELVVAEKKDITPLVLLSDALHSGASPEVLKELVSLQQSMVRFDWEAQERQSKIDFDDSLNECQQEIGRIAPNVNRLDTKSWWADYAQLDRTVRPIYTKHRFSIGYSEVAPLAVGKVRIQAILSRAGVAREYYSEITPSTTGPKGGAMATATDADAIAASRAKRYLLLSIFNIAVGIDKIEKEGIPEDNREAFLSAIKTAPDKPSLDKVYISAKKEATAKNDTESLRLFTEAGASRAQELKNAQVH